MPTHFKWKLSSRKKAKTHNSKAKKTVKLRPWDDSITDLSVYSSTPEEVKQRQLSHKSNNLEIAKMELLEKRIVKYKNTDNEEVDKTSDYAKPYNEKKCIAVPRVTLAPKSAETESTVTTTINEDYRNINCCSDSRRIADGSIDLRDINEREIHNGRNLQENNYSPNLTITEVEKVLHHLQRKLHAGEENNVDVPALFSKSESCFSGFTSLFLNTLDKLSRKCIKACEELTLEKRKRKELQDEVEMLKHKVNTLVQDVIGLQTTISEINKRPEMLNSQVSQKEKDQQSQFDPIRISNNDTRKSLPISVVIEKGASGKTQCSFPLQSSDSSFCIDRNKFSDSTYKNSDNSNNSYCNNTYLDNMSFSSNLQQSPAIAIMLRPPVQLDMIHRHCNA